MGGEAKHARGFWKTGLGYMTQFGIALTAVAGIVGGIATITGSGGADRASAAPALDVLDLTVSGEEKPVCLGDPLDPPRLDITVRNTGRQPALITRLGLRVRATGLLTIPQAGGGLDPSKNYDVLLPAKPRVGQLLLYKLSQEVGPRASDRFTVRLDQPEPSRQIGVRLYQLEVMLHHDDERTPLDAGTALVAVPYVPGKDFFWSGVAPEFRSSYTDSPVVDILEDNEKTFRRMLALPGARPASLSLDIVDVPVTSSNPNLCGPSTRRGEPTPQEPLGGGALDE